MSWGSDLSASIVEPCDIERLLEWCGTEELYKLPECLRDVSVARKVNSRLLQWNAFQHAMKGTPLSAGERGELYRSRSRSEPQ